jgi:hypothetical protein
MSGVGVGGILCISSVTLVNFTLYNNQLSKYYKIDLYTPSLCTFTFTCTVEIYAEVIPCTPYQTFSGSNVSSLKHVEIYAEVIPYQKGPPMCLLSMLLKFPNIKSLTVSTSTLQVPLLTMFEGYFYFLLKMLFYLFLKFIKHN